MQAGTKENVIPDEAIIKLNVRTFDAGVRKRVLAAIERIVNAEAAASGAPRPPEITPLDRYSLVTNDPAASQRVVEPSMIKSIEVMKYRAGAMRAEALGVIVIRLK